jgi:CRISPR-associated protein Csy1
MLDPAIEGFLCERKEERAKNKTKKHMSDAQKDEILAEANAFFELSKFLERESKRAGQIAITSHPAKFTHPSIKKDYISFVGLKFKKIPDGFLKSGSVDVEIDGFGGAAGLIAYKFLTQKMQDGKMILQHLDENTDLIREQFSLSEESYQEVRSKFLSVKAAGSGMDKTHERLKQAYFPVDDDYHLLSILTSSGLMFKLKQRINHIRYSEQAKQAREARRAGKHDGKGFAELPNLTEIGFGGTKPQNISVLNSISSNRGKAYLLQSLPPTLKSKKKARPKTNFFTSTLNVWHYKESFASLHRLLVVDSNTIHIRQGRDKIIQFVITQVIERIWTLRQIEAGWTDHESCKLPLNQKILLDQQYREQREAENEWLTSVKDDLSRWFLQAYKRIIGRQARGVGGDEMPHIKKIIDANEEGLR